MSKFFEWWYDKAIGRTHPSMEDYVLGIVASLGVLMAGTLVLFLTLAILIASRGLVLIPLGILGGLIYGLVNEGRKRRNR